MKIALSKLVDFFATEIGKAFAKFAFFVLGVCTLFIFNNAKRGVVLGAEIDEFKQLYARDRVEDSIQIKQLKTGIQVQLLNQEIISEKQDSTIMLINEIKDNEIEFLNMFREVRQELYKQK